MRRARENMPGGRGLKIPAHPHHNDNRQGHNDIMDTDSLRIQRDAARIRYKRLLMLLGLIEHIRETAPVGRWYVLRDRSWSVREALTELGMQL